MIVYISTGTEA